MQENRLLLKVEQDSNPVEASSSNQIIFGENELSDSPQNRILRYKKNRSSAHEVKVVTLVDLEEVFFSVEEGEDGAMYGTQ